MKVIGYLVVLALFGGQHKSFFDNVSNLSIDIQNVGKLFTKLFRSNITTDGPIFTEEDVHRANFINKGTVAKYYSKALRDYIVYHNVSAEEEGFVVTLNNINKPPAVKEESATNKEDKIPRVIFLPKHGVNIKDKTLNRVIAEYIDNIQNKIDSKEIGVVEKITRNGNLPVDDNNKNLIVHPADQRQTVALEELNKSNGKNIKFLNVNKETAGNNESKESLVINNTETRSSGSDLNNPENNSPIDENMDTDISTSEENSEEQSETAPQEELNKSNDKDIKVLDVGEEKTTSNEALDINKTETISSDSVLSNTGNIASIEENKPTDNSTKEEISEGSVPEILTENQLTDNIKEYDSNTFMPEISSREINFDN